jgi:formylglycine-generating enzyme required for sulfatase activity
MLRGEQTITTDAKTRPSSRGKVAMIALATVAVAAVVVTSLAPSLEESPDAPTTAAAKSEDSAGAALAERDVVPSPPPAPTLPPLSERCPDGMALVPGGKFYRGSDDAKYARWQPAHKVTLDPYCLDLREVTAKQYKECSDAGGCKRLPPRSSWHSSASPAEQAAKEEAFSAFCNFGVAGREDHPMNCISWADAQNYCNERGARLPTEAEWEFAARGSDGRSFPWGDTPPDHTVMNACGEECTRWHEENELRPSPQMYDQDDGFPGTAPVGTFPKGRTMFGMDDMVGNVFEWTEDWFAVYDPPEKGALPNPSGPETGDKRVVRGGAFNGGFVLWVNPAFRYGMNPTDHSHGVGMRCALTPELQPEERIVGSTTNG